MIYGYARISTNKQDISRQIRNMIAFDKNIKIYQEVFTGTKTTARVEFQKLLRKVRADDTIVFDSVSRMSRNAEEGFALYKKLFEQGVSLVFLNERYIDTDVYAKAKENLVPMTGGDVDVILQGVNAYLMKLAERQVQLAFEQAQKERDDLAERTRQGLETARLNGKTLGRQPGTRLSTRKSDACKKKMLQYSRTFGGSVTDKDLIQMLGIDKNTFYKYKRELMIDGVEEAIGEIT